ncbi:hypothetical protein U5A82_00790 [Sphingobium sp. CR2-8]|uniref:hypothetical protein n=1 Tax=Sphingobium sp. CR2-8 TaxID=1306534 RepID=UPI002DB5A278|nr:hypothetical protein [Sphingobium sp. CR2-8]MEC3909057.1 hypothetical protein [Sphingobium sp. CR2-8]
MRLLARPAAITWRAAWRLSPDFRARRPFLKENSVIAPEASSLGCMVWGDMAEHSDNREDEDFLCGFLKRVSPLWLLNGFMTTLTKRDPRNQDMQLWEDISLSGASGGATSEEIAVMNAKADTRRSMLEANPVFLTSIARLTAVGVSPKWSSDGDPGFRARVLRLFIPLEAIPQIQDMAAEDAGIESGPDRLEAAEIYRRWLLQSYHPDWERYREKWPTLYKTPYNTARNDFGRDPNPIKP